LFTKAGQDAIKNKMPINGNWIQSEAITSILRRMEGLDSKIDKATRKEGRANLISLQGLFTKRKELNFELSSILAEQGVYMPKADNSVPSVQC
jgi:hypothetical protein